jgi:hypothetical protein
MTYSRGERPCRVCGATSGRWYCTAHDPDRARRREAHEARRAAYMARLGRPVTDKEDRP